MSLTKLERTVLLLIVLLLAGCDSDPPDDPRQVAEEERVQVQDLDITTGQTIYVPAYSEIYFAGEGRTLELAVTLAIHNTDFDHPIILTSVRYYSTQGQLVQEYLPQPRRLGPLAATDFFVDASEQQGGLGTNFIVEWVAEQPVFEPVVEAIMISTSGTQGISFTSPGRVISQLEVQGE